MASHEFDPKIHNKGIVFHVGDGTSPGYILRPKPGHDLVYAFSDTLHGTEVFGLGTFKHKKRDVCRISFTTRGTVDLGGNSKEMFIGELLMRMRGVGNVANCET